jgi:hypothetical protein
MPQLIVIYGAPLTGKSSLARAVAESLDDKAAIVSVDAMLDEAILVHDRDTFAELEMVYTQARLLVANYLKNRYHAVLEGAFEHDVDGVAHHREAEIDQTTALMRNIAMPPLLVRLTALPETLRVRAHASLPHRDFEAAVRIDGAYKERYGGRSLVLSTDDRATDDLAQEVLERLRAG